MKYLLLAVLMFGSAAYAQEAPNTAPQPVTGVKHQIDAVPVQKMDKTTPAPKAPDVVTIPQPKEWADKYAEYIALMKQIQKIYADAGLDKLEQLATTLQTELRKSVPEGFQPDANGNFIKVTTPTPEKK